LANGVARGDLGVVQRLHARLQVRAQIGALGLG
jgi:hypothetical protein